MKQKTHINKIVSDLFVLFTSIRGVKYVVPASWRGVKVLYCWLLGVEKGLVYYGAAVLIVGIMLLTVSEIIVRRLMGTSIVGVFEGIELMLVIIVYLGLAHTQHLGRHVRVELVITRVTFKVRLAMEVFTGMVSVAFFSLAVWMTGKQAWDSWLIKEITFVPSELPIWVARGFIPIGIFFLWLRLLIQIGQHIYNLLKKSPSI